MLRVHYSNRFEALTAALNRTIGPERDPLQKHTLVVPNRAVASFVKLELAEARGAMIGVEQHFFEPFLLSRVVHAGRSPVLCADSLHVALALRLSDEELLAHPEMEPVHHYVSPPGQSEDDRERRRFELSRELARLYHQYAVERPELLARFESHAHASSPVAAWQRRLWLAVTDNGRRRHFLTELLRTPPEELGLPAALHMIGFSFLGTAHYAALEHLSRAADVHVYAVNPSREFWEDGGGGGAPALRMWGRLGNQHVRSLNTLSQWDFADHFEDPIGNSALAETQRQLLEDRATRSAATDESIRILAAANPRRELEILASEITLAMRAQPELAFSDIALLIAGEARELYHAHLGVVFREFGIPFHILDRPLAEGSRLAEALDLLLDLPLGNYSRPELLRLLVHPAVVGRYPFVDPDDWVQWACRLGIVHGVDRNDHRGTYIERDVFHWEQGLRRLAFGAFMSARDPARGSVRAGASELIPEEVPADRLRSAGQFVLLCRKLIGETRGLIEERHSLADWGRRLDRLAGQFLAPGDDFEEGNLERCREALRQLGGPDGGHVLVTCPPTEKVGYRTAREFARARLSALQSLRGEPLAEGVMVGALQAMRPVPFRMLCIAGLGEAFPGEERPNPLDLQQDERKPGDATARQRNHLAFLEALLGAREQLVLSYVNHDAQTGESRAPSQVLLDLAEMCGTATERHPLRRFDPEYFPELFGKSDRPAWPDETGRRQARALLLRRSLDRHFLERGQAVPSHQELLLELSRQQPEVARELGIALADLPPLEPTGGERELSISRLRSFLECPFQAWTGIVIGLREFDLSDRTATSHEPFAFDRPAEVGMLRDIITAHALAPGKQELTARYKERFDYQELSGQTPTGVFSRIARDNHLELLGTWQRELERVAGGAPITLDSFGEARENAPLGCLRPRVALELDSGTVDLIGQGELTVGDRSTVAFLARAPLPKDLFRGYLTMAVRAAAGLGDGGPFSVWSIGRERTTGRRFPGWTQAAALAYLTALASDLYEQPHPYFLPCDLVFDSRKAAGVTLAELALPYLRGKACATSFGPVRRFESLRPPEEARAREIIERRFGNFLAGEDIG